MYFITLPSPQYYIHFPTICTNYFQTEMVVKGISVSHEMSVCINVIVVKTT